MFLTVVPYHAALLLDARMKRTQLGEQLEIENRTWLRLHEVPHHAVFGVKACIQLFELCLREKPDFGDRVHGPSSWSNRQKLLIPAFIVANNLTERPTISIQ